MSEAVRGVHAAVGRAWWRFHVARFAECVCLGLAAALVTLAAAVISGAPLDHPELPVAAGLCALACGAAWWVEQRRTLAQVARRLDTGLQREGALVTAFECAGRSGRGELEELLLEREARRLDPAARRRAIAPPSVAFVAAPLIAAAGLSMALDREPLARDLQAPGSVASVAGSGAADAGQDSAAGPAELQAESPGTPTDSAPDLPAELDAAAVPAAARPVAPVFAATPPESALSGDDLSGSPGSTLAPGADGSTMAGSAPPGEHLTQGDDPMILHSDSSSGVPDSGAEPAEPGVLVGRWWPTHYDAIVRDWTAGRAGRVGAERP